MVGDRDKGQGGRGENVIYRVFDGIGEVGGLCLCLYEVGLVGLGVLGW